MKEGRVCQEAKLQEAVLQRGSPMVRRLELVYRLIFGRSE